MQIPRHWPLQLYTAAPPQSAAEVHRAAGPEAGAASEPVRIDLVHVNDVHGALEPVKDPKLSPDALVGGVPRIKTVIDRVRAENPEGTLALNAGDMAEGTMVSYLTRGESVAKALDAVGFDAIALGNHDFAWGQEALHGMLALMDAPVVAANVVRTADGQVMDGAQPFVMKDVKGVKVGILGLDTPNIRHYIADHKLQGLRFDDGVETVRKWLPEMKAQGADVVVVLSHMGYEEDLKLAEAVPGLDVIVGGHSHTELPGGTMVDDTLVVQAGSMTRYVGQVSLDFDPAARRVVGHEAKLLPVRVGEVEPDPEVSRIIAPYLAEAEEKGSVPMGTATEELHYAHRAAGMLNQIHADSLLKATGAEFCICNSRTLRGHVPAGTVTYKDLYSALPFTEENYVTMTVTGRQVLAEIEDDLRNKATELAVPAGLRYEYDPALPEGSRVTSVTLENGNPLHLDREYRIVTNETMSRKPAFKEARDKVVHGPVQPLFFEAFTAGSPWRNQPDLRVVRLRD